jgi:hypothetical protein
MSIEISSVGPGLDPDLDLRAIQKIVRGPVQSAVPEWFMDVSGRTSGLGGMGGLGEFM